MDERSRVVEGIARTLGIAPSIRRLIVKTIDNPWDEKALVKRKVPPVDVKLLVWDNPAFLYGRIYRLLLYVYDLLDPAFSYESVKPPNGELYPKVRERYAQIWSIYVDSRLERNSIDNFYDRTVRRNLFIESREDVAREENSAIFDALWARPSYTHSDIVDAAQKLAAPTFPVPASSAAKAEIEVAALLKNNSSEGHLGRIASPRLGQLAKEILAFTETTSKESTLRSSYYGICMDYERRCFGELVCADDHVFVTLIDDFQKPNTFEIQEKSDIEQIKQAIAKTVRTCERASHPERG